MRSSALTEVQQSPIMAHSLAFNASYKPNPGNPGYLAHTGIMAFAHWQSGVAQIGLSEWNLVSAARRGVANTLIRGQAQKCPCRDGFRFPRTV